MVTFIILRHGESESNRARTFTGQSDAPLSARGRAEAAATAAYVLQHYRPDAVYASDLCRARDTAHPIAEALGLPVLTRRDLRETDVGLWQGLTPEQVRERFGKTFAVFKQCPGLVHFDGGESYADVTARATAAFADIAAQNEGKCVLVAAHGGLLRTLRAAWEGVPLEELSRIPTLTNCSVSVAEYAQGRGVFTLLDHTGHLAPGALFAPLP